MQYATTPGTKAVDYSRITLGNGGGPVTLSNVADRVQDNNAVNVQQLNAGLGGAVRQSTLTPTASSRTCATIWTATGATRRAAPPRRWRWRDLAQAYLPGRGMFWLGGAYDGQQGFAMGLSTVSGNGKWVYRCRGPRTRAVRSVRSLGQVFSGEGAPAGKALPLPAGVVPVGAVLFFS